MMSQPMILGGTSIEAVVHGVTADPHEPGLLLGAGLGFFPFGHGRPALHQARPARAAGGGHGRGRGAPRLRHRREHRAPGRGRRRPRLRRVRGDARRPRPGAVDRRRAASATSASATSTTATASTSPPLPAARRRGKRRVRKREIAYRAPTRSRRNVFGAYTLYDLMARLVLGDPVGYTPTAPRPSTPVGLQRHRRDRAPAAPLARPDRHARERPAHVGARTSAARSERAA